MTDVTPDAAEAPVTIRLADGNDLDGVVDVGRTSCRSTYASLVEPEMLDLLLAKWWTKSANAAAIRARRTFVAEQDGRIVAMASYGTRRSWLIIWKIYILEEFQGQGIGGRLLEAIYEQAALGHDNAYLSFTEGNAKAEVFAHRHGYAEVHREEQGGMPDLVWMGRALERTGPDGSEVATGHPGGGVE